MAIGLVIQSAQKSKAYPPMRAVRTSPSPVLNPGACEQKYWQDAESTGLAEFQRTPIVHAYAADNVASRQVNIEAARLLAAGCS